MKKMSFVLIMSFVLTDKNTFDLSLDCVLSAEDRKLVAGSFLSLCLCFNARYLVYIWCVNISDATFIMLYKAL